MVSVTVNDGKPRHTCHSDIQTDVNQVNEPPTISFIVQIQITTQDTVRLQSNLQSLTKNTGIEFVVSAHSSTPL